MNAPVFYPPDLRSVGALLIVGDGVAGVPAALDLTELGRKLYPVEKGGAIGGVIFRRDKNFPANDCSFCILISKQLKAGCVPNIAILIKPEWIALSHKNPQTTPLHRRGVPPRYGQCSMGSLKQIGAGQMRKGIDGMFI